MPTIAKIFAYGKLDATTASWIQVREQVTLLDISIHFDTSLDRTMVSVIGLMGIPQASPFTKLIVEQIVGHDTIAKRAYEISQSSQGTFANDNWLRAERALLAA